MARRHNPLRVWRHGGRQYVSGLFEMHDREGLSLADSLIECGARGLIACLLDFRACALRAGWSSEKVERLISSSIADARACGLTPRRVD